MTRVIRPRQEFPTPLFRLVSPVLLVAPVAVWDVTALPHGVLAAILLLGATALAAPLTLLARNRLGLICAVLSAAILGWLAAVVIVFLLYPPD